MFSLIRAAIDALLPPGFAWKADQDEGFDQLLDGISDVIDNDGLSSADSLADIRNPSKTPVFDDLERNYGINPNDTIPVVSRISRLSQKVYQGAKVNSIDDIQSALTAAGFDLQVHKNDPPVDPDLFLGGGFQMTAGSDYAYAGYNDGVNILAFAGVPSATGTPIVNTPIFSYEPAFAMQAGGGIAYAGYTSDGANYESVAGYFTSYTKNYLTYPTPGVGYWSMFWFIGGDATRDPVTGALLSIDQGNVPLNRQDELLALLLACKTAGSWIGLIISYT